MANTPRPADGSPFATFLALDDEERKKILARTHPLYADKAASWQVFLDAYEGSGGFENGDYLWKYPREEPAEFEARQTQARYHNYAKALVNLYVRHVFHDGVDRQTKDEGLSAWWTNVDGAGTTIDDLMRRAAHLALAMGHDGILVDKTAAPATGPSKADEHARVVATVFTPLNIKDWRIVRDELVALKLEEAIESADLLEKDEDETDDAERHQYLLWSKTDGFLRVDEHGAIVEQPGRQGFDAPPLGLVPFTVLRPEASAAHPFLGQSLLGNANLFKALFNRCSEEDEVLRAGSFSMLTVSVPKDTDVEKVKAQVGSEVGSTRAIIAEGTITYTGPDQAVPAAVRDAIKHLVQEIYRMAHVGEQRDSREAESAEAIRLKQTELNEMLTGLAAALTRCENDLVRFYYAWTTNTPAAAESQHAASQATVTYSREFFLTDLLQQLEIWAEAIALDLGLTFTQRLKVKAANTLDPDMDEKTRAQVEQEIKAQPPPAPPVDPNVLRERALGRLSGEGDEPPKPAPSEDEGEGDA